MRPLQPGICAECNRCYKCDGTGLANHGLSDKDRERYGCKECLHCNGSGYSPIPGHLKEKPRQITVAELITILQTMPQDAKVDTEGCDCYGPSDGATLESDGSVLITRMYEP
jgi:hypothetical protein